MTKPVTTRERGTAQNDYQYRTFRSRTDPLNRRFWFSIQNFDDSADHDLIVGVMRHLIASQRWGKTTRGWHDAAAQLLGWLLVTRGKTLSEFSWCTSFSSGLSYANDVLTDRYQLTEIHVHCNYSNNFVGPFPASCPRSSASPRYHILARWFAFTRSHFVCSSRAAVRQSLGNRPFHRPIPWNRAPRILPTRYASCQLGQ